MMDLVGVQVWEIILMLLGSVVAGFIPAAIVITIIDEVRHRLGRGMMGTLGDLTTAGITVSLVFVGFLYVFSNTSSDRQSEQFIRSCDLVLERHTEQECVLENKIDDASIKVSTVNNLVSIEYDGQLLFYPAIRRRTSIAVYDAIHKSDKLNQAAKSQKIVDIMESNLRTKLEAE